MKKFARGGWMVLGNLLVMGSGCGPSARMLSAQDVSNVPPGDATGTELSGTYLLASFSIEDCECRTGTCSFVHTGAEETFTVVQSDGALMVTDSTSGNVIMGGVDANYSFTCGGVSMIPSTVGQGSEYNLLTGTFDVSGGQPTWLHYQLDATITGNVQGMNVDCDFLGAGSARYEGP